MRNTVAVACHRRADLSFLDNRRDFRYYSVVSEGIGVSGGSKRIRAMAPVLRWLFVVISGIVAGYIGVSVYGELRLIRATNLPSSEKSGAVIYDGIAFENAASLEVYKLEKDRDRFHPWTEPLEEWLALLVLASSAGFLGGLFRFIVDSLDPKKTPSIVRCLMGMGIGICLMAVAWASETLILEGEPRFRYETLAAVCFLAGIFVHEAWKFVSMQAQKVFG